MREQRPYGKHELYIEGDLITVVAHGLLTLDELHLFTSVADELIARHGHLLFMSDNTNGNEFEPTARRYVAQWSVGKPVLGIAIYNANLISRTLFSLILKATNVIRKQPLPFDFFKTEAEARRWLALLREQHLAKLERLGRSGDGPPSHLT